MDYLEQTKKDIQQAIIAKGVEVGNDVTFRDYAAKVAAISGGGGGETVYAVNNTGAAVTKGMKAWLNKHNLNENVAYEFKDGFIVGGAVYFIFDKDNNLITVQTNGTTRTGFVYNVESKTWQETTLTKSALTQNYSLRQYSDVAATYYEKTCAIQSETASFALNGIYLGQGLALSYVSSGNYKLIEVDIATGNTVRDIYTFTVGTGNLYSAALSGNILFFATGGDNYFFYNITGWNNEFFEFTPPMLKSGTYAGLGNYANKVLYATGTSVGDYLFLAGGVGQAGRNDFPLTLVKIHDRYVLGAADDVSPDLASLIGQTVYAQYYNDSNVLTVGTMTGVQAFEFKDGQFTTLNVAITLPEKAKDTDCYRFFLSRDMAAAVILYCTNSYNNTYSAGFYKLATSSNDWYADRFGMASSLSLTGFATGATDEAGRYEFKTVTGA